MSHSESEGDDSEPLCTIHEDPHRNFPTFTFSEKMKKRLYKAWHQAVIVKLLGRSIGYKLLLSILQAMWAKKGVISLINVGNGFFVVKFTNREDFSNALTGGPWMVFDHYLIVRPWEPQFQPWRASIEKLRRSKKGGKEKVAGFSGHQNQGSRFGVLAVDDEGRNGIVNSGIGQVDGSSDHTTLTGEVEEPRISSQVRLTREKNGGSKKKQTKQQIVEGGSALIAGEGQHQRKDKRSRDMVKKGEAKRENQKVAEDYKMAVAEYAEETTMVAAESDVIGMSSSNAKGDPLWSVSSDTVVFSSIPYDPGDLHMNLSSGPCGKFWASPGKEGMECEVPKGVILEQDIQVAGPVDQVD
ncbi:hypothetical protein K1719_033706 [Acacia pycnantha]|nr:hypothetical protein K1719_033706 [Acacia pycnantha]